MVLKGALVYLKSVLRGYGLCSSIVFYMMSLNLFWLEKIILITFYAFIMSAYIMPAVYWSYVITASTLSFLNK